MRLLTPSYQPHDQRNGQEYEEDVENHLGNVCRSLSYSAKAKQRCNKCNHEED